MPMIFRISMAAELHLGPLPSVSDILALPVLSLRSTGIPSMLKLHWLKSTFARNNARFIQLKIMGGEAWTQAASQNLSGHGCLPIESRQSENFAEAKIFLAGENRAVLRETRLDRTHNY